MPDDDPAVAEAPPPAETAPPSPPVELHVNAQGQIAEAGPKSPPPKRGSAMSRMFQELNKKAQPTTAPAPSPEQPASPTTPTAETAPAEGEETPPDGSPQKPHTTEPQAAAPAEGKPGDKKKISPWKLVDEYKGRAATLEKELAELKKAVPDPKEKETITAKLTEAEKRLQAAEQELRYANYAKSQEFQEKYQKPYEQAWEKAMGDLKELTVADETGAERPMSPQDLLALVNMPLREARAQAVQWFGDFADDVMNHRKEIRSLFEAQSNALDKARKESTEREEQRQRMMQEFHTKSTEQLKTLWTQVNDEVLKDDKVASYFKPVDGDEEGNQRLAKGYEIADKAFAMPDPRDPRLTPEQRMEIVRLHAAVRHRAAAFGRTNFQLQQAQAKIKALETELNKFKGAQPGKGEGSPKTATAAPASARDRVFAALQKYAH